MADSAPAPLTDAERVALGLSSQVLRSAAATLRTEWAQFEKDHPGRATDDVTRGFLMAVKRISYMADAIERNVARG